MMEAKLLVQNSGQNPARGRILYFHVEIFKREYLELLISNQAIQKPKFIYAYRTTTFMKD
jgi:hypothetical protein